MTLTPYIIALRAVIYCETEVDAIMAADVVREEGQKHLDADDGDELYVSQVIPFTEAINPQELIDRIIRTRNDLIKTKIKQCWDVAKELDYIVYGLKYRMDPLAAGTYDHGRFMEIAAAIYKGEWPNV